MFQCLLDAQLRGARFDTPCVIHPVFDDGKLWKLPFPAMNPDLVGIHALSLEFTHQSETNV